MDIYSAGEDPISGVTSRLIFDAMKSRENAYMISNRSDLVCKVRDMALSNTKSKGIILTVGAGDVYKIGQEIVNV
jgi:UDP-N-acetylmuramate-alanine ligase